MRLLAKSNTARRKRAVAEVRRLVGRVFDDRGLPASVARRADNGPAMGGHIDKSYDSSGSDNRRVRQTVVIPLAPRRGPSRSRGR
jgi:hypothetical protein